MATLHKFKLLATHCAAAGSPSRSPSATPVSLRRRKTLRMFLTRPNSHRRRDDHPNRPISHPSASPGAAPSLKLKDFLLSSPPPPPPPQKAERVPERVGDAGGRASVGGGGRVAGVVGVRQLRPLTATLRQRLLRKSWRPVLVSIPE